MNAPRNARGFAKAAIVGMLAFGLMGCGGSSSERALPKAALISRAWAGREPAPTERGMTAVYFAQSQVGHRYCWGGEGPSCFDCSGLVQRAWGWAGVRVPRTSDAIAEQLAPVAIDDVRAGDILWWPGHVGIYAGNGWMVDALDSKHGVVRRAAKDPWRAFRPAVEVSALPSAPRF
jgi:cell wall-associated NlpC family hydrolase